MEEWRVVIEDLDAAAAVARLGPQGWADDVLRSMPAVGRALVLSTGAGDVAALAYTPPRCMFPAYLAHVTTRPTTRRQGHGLELVEELKRYGLGPIEARADSAAGAELLRRAGFIETGDLVTPWRFDP